MTLAPEGRLGGDTPLGSAPDSLDPLLLPAKTPGAGDCLSWTLCLLLFLSTKNASREAERATPITPATVIPAIAPVPMPALLAELWPAELKGCPLPADAPGAGPEAVGGGGAGAGNCPCPVGGDSKGPRAALAAICSADCDELAEGKEEFAGVATGVAAGVLAGTREGIEEALGRVASRVGELKNGEDELV